MEFLFYILFGFSVVLLPALLHFFLSSRHSSIFSGFAALYPSQVGTMNQPFFSFFLSSGMCFFYLWEITLLLHNALTIHTVRSASEAALSKVISWIFLQREAIWPLCVQIKGQYGTVAPSLAQSQGSRVLQQSATTLTGSLRLIGFDIEKWPPAAECFSDRYPPCCLSFCSSYPPCPPLSFPSISELWGFVKSVYLFVLVQGPALIVS